MKTVSIIIVENDSELRNKLRHAFESRGYVAWNCRDPEFVACLLESVQPSIIILDLDISDFEGDIFAVMGTWHTLSPKTRVIVESANSDAERMRKALVHGAEAFLTKPFSLDPLFNLLDNTISSAPHQTQAA